MTGRKNQTKSGCFRDEETTDGPQDPAAQTACGEFRIKINQTQSQPETQTVQRTFGNTDMTRR